jgi:replicative DNA helicase
MKHDQDQEQKQEARNLKIPPQNSEAEQTVLGATIIDNSIIPKILEIIAAEDFYRDAHRQIFSAIIDLSKEGEADIITVPEELQKRGQLENVGGASYLISLTDAVPSTINVVAHAEIIKEKSVLRQLINGATELASEAYDGRLEVILPKLQKLSVRIIAKTDTGKSPKKLEMSGILKRIGSLRETPYHKLNEAITGFLEKEIIIVAGRPNFGKTSFNCGLLRHTAMIEKRPAIYFGTAFSEERFHVRLLSAETGVPFNDLIKGRVPKGQASKVLKAQKNLDKAPIYQMIEPEKMNILTIIAKTQKIKNDLGDLGIIVIENLQELTFPGISKIRKEELDAIASALTGLTDEIKTPIVISCQMNRTADEREDGRPTLGDIKDTGSVGEKAIKVFLLYRPVYYQNLKQGIRVQTFPELAEVIIAKGGPIITIPHLFNGPTYSWTDADT